MCLSLYYTKSVISNFYRTVGYRLLLELLSGQMMMMHCLLVSSILWTSVVAWPRHKVKESCSGYPAFLYSLSGLSIFVIQPDIALTSRIIDISIRSYRHVASFLAPRQHSRAFGTCKTMKT